MLVTRRTFLLGTAALLGTQFLAGCTSPGPEPSDEGALAVHFLKVGKADAMVCLANGSCIMVDTGDAGSADDVVESLLDLGVSRIDKMIITHFDQDHVGGAAAVLLNFDVAEVLTTYQSKSSEEIDAYEEALAETDTPARTLTADETVTIGKIVLDILTPRRTAYEEDTSNNSSLVVKLTFDSIRMLLAGDIQQERIQELVSGGTDLAADLLKVPHHGAWEDNLADLVDACGARYAVICCSNKKPEDERVTDLLEESGAEVFVTREGEVIATTDGKTLEVTQP